MNPSKKKIAAGGITTAASEKEDKKAWHKIFRRKNKILAKQDDAIAELTYLHAREVSDVWGMAKDGKVMYADTDKEKRK